MRFNQFIPDPISNRSIVRNVEVNIDDVRLNGEYANKVRIFAYCDGATCIGEPDKSYYHVLDNKRTFRSPEEKIAKIVLLEDNWIWIDNYKEFNPKINDPIALISEKETVYAFISEVLPSKFAIKSFSGSKVNYLVGMLIQNLNGVESKPVTSKGVLALLSMPEQPQFSVDKSENGIIVAISPPQYPHRCKFYDIYVRDESFSDIGHFWFPDIFDKPFSEEYNNIVTFNGGKDAGGGNIEKNKAYYVTAVGKDEVGFKNVNESSCKKIEIIFVQ